MGSTIRVEESVQIAKSPAEVWDAIADYAFDLEWRKGLREMTPDPPGPPATGTRVHEVVRSSGRDYIADTVVTDLDPGVSYRFAGTGTIGGVGGGRAVRADEAGTGAVFSISLRTARISRPLGLFWGAMHVWNAYRFKKFATGTGVRASFARQSAGQT